MSAPTDLPSLLANNSDVSAWRERQLAAGVMEVDVNDQIVVWAVARRLFNERPHRRQALNSQLPLALTDVLRLGMFAGAANLLRLIGDDPSEAQALVLSVIPH